MGHLSPAVRHKAVEIANAVLAQEGDEGKAIRIGIAKAKEWAWHHGAAEGPEDLPAGIRHRF